MTKSKTLRPDLKVSGVCGLFCSSCSIYIASNYDPERLLIIASGFNKSIEEIRCEGCRSDVLSSYCKTCKMKKCASLKGINFCGECDEYPCDDLKKFQSVLAHRIELWESHKIIKKAGYQRWFNKMIDHYSCPECHTINSAYDDVCWKCGRNPSCSYVELNKEEINKRKKL